MEELHQFDRLKVWELVDKPFGKMIIKLKWLWKNKKDEDQTFLGDELVSWMSKKQNCTAMSSAEAELRWRYSASCAQSNVDEDTT
ncbi:hypothetical protein Tco_0564930 [Tanacetum coccineum]